MKVALYCVLDSLSSDSYSLTQVLIDQAKMLAMAGHDPEIWLLDDWSLDNDPVARALLTDYPAVRLNPVLPRIRLYNYSETHGKDPNDYASDDDPEPTFAEKVVRIVNALTPVVRDVDVVISHDITFQNYYLPHGMAARQVETYLGKKVGEKAPWWLHWQHSASSLPPDPLPPFPWRSKYAPMPRSTFVYVNETPDERNLVAAQRGIPERELVFVPNTRDICEYFAFDSRTKDFVRKNNLLDADLIFAMPANLGDGKQPRKALMVVRAFREHKVDARLVWASSSTDQDRLTELKVFANDLGLPTEAFVLTAEHCPEWAKNAPRETVRSLQQLADGLILASLSEAHSLVAMEAALTRQVLIVNHDFEAMEHWFPHGAVHRWHFCSTRRSTQYHAREGEGEFEAELRYYRMEALKMLHNLQFQNSLRAFRFVRKCRSLEYVYNHYMGPLLASVSG